jgi:hypothetical protein
MNYRLSVAPGSPGEKLLQLLAETWTSRPEAQALRENLERCLEAKRQGRFLEAVCTGAESS